MTEPAAEFHCYANKPIGKKTDLLTQVAQAAFLKLGINPLAEPDRAYPVSQASLLVTARAIQNVCEAFCGETYQTCDPEKFRAAVVDTAASNLVAHFAAKPE